MNDTQGSACQDQLGYSCTKPNHGQVANAVAAAPARHVTGITLLINPMPQRELLCDTCQEEGEQDHLFALLAIATTVAPASGSPSPVNRLSYIPSPQEEIARRRAAGLRAHGHGAATDLAS
jgi:hypothetical protein